MSLVKLMTPTTTLSGKPRKSQPIYFRPSDVVGIRPASGPYAGGSIIATSSMPDGAFVRESPSLAYKRLFVEPEAESKRQREAFRQRHPIAMGIASSEQMERPT